MLLPFQTYSSPIKYISVVTCIYKLSRLKKTKHIMPITLQKKLLTIVMILLLHSAECYINGKRENFLMISETEQHQSYSSNNSFDMDHM